ncbi:conserved hypothetical protein, partial [Ricinus communis]
MAHKRVDQRRPLLRIGMRRVALPVEDAQVRAAHGQRREAQFHERLDAHLQQAVIQVIDPGPVVHRLAVHLLVRAQHVVEDGVEADVAEAQFIARDLQLRQAVVADQ